MITKKYGVFGLMEWKAVLRVGQASLHVSFTGGFENEYGTNPASFTTSDPIVQHIIEHCEPFIKGKIRLIGKYGEEVPIIKEKTEPSVGDVKKENSNLKKVDASDWESAKDYLETNYGVPRSDMRYKKNVEAIAASKGILFVVKE